MENMLVSLQSWKYEVLQGGKIHPQVRRSLPRSLYVPPLPVTHRDRVEVVVKVFAKHDPSLNLKPHENRLHGTVTTPEYVAFTSVYILTDIRVRLHGVGNALPFQKFWVSILKIKSWIITVLYHSVNLGD